MTADRSALLLLRKYAIDVPMRKQTMLHDFKPLITRPRLLCVFSPNGEGAGLYNSALALTITSAQPRRVFHRNHSVEYGAIHN